MLNLLFRVLLTLFGVAIPLSALSAEAPLPTTMDVNQGLVNFAPYGLLPFIDQNGRLVIPVRAAASALGATVAWDAKNATATLTFANTAFGIPVTLQFQPGSSVFRKETPVGNANIQMDTTVEDVQNRLALPARYIAESIGDAVIWHGDTRRVSVITPSAIFAAPLPPVSPRLAKNIPPDPNPYPPCIYVGDTVENGYCLMDSSGNTRFDTPLATQAAIAAINNALASEGYTPIAVPADFWTKTDADQFVLLLNLVRRSMGLAALTPNAQLNSLAMQGASQNNDPPPPGGQFVGTFGGVWAGNLGPAEALYDFLFNDGYGSSNLDCKTPSDPGCWGHRQALLQDYGPNGQIGVAETTVAGSSSIAAAMEGN